MCSRALLCGSLVIAASLNIAAGATWEGSRNGHCDHSGYMNLGFHGMSEEKCRDRAFETNSDSCRFVSYSSSAVPTASGNFCRCYPACDSLVQPSGDSWSSYTVTDCCGSSNKLGLILGLSIGGGVLVCILAAACIFRFLRMRKTGGKNNENGKDNGTPVVVTAEVIDNNAASA